MNIQLFIFGIISGLLLTINSIAQPQNIHLSWSGSKITDPGKTIAITWSSNQPDNNTVKYGKDSIRLNRSAKALEKAPINSNPLFVYKAEIQALRLAKKYYYQCGSDEAGWSAVYSFKTAPKPGKKDKFRVAVWGDTQNNGGNYQFEQTRVIVDQLKKYPINLSIHMGDIVENGSVVESWNKFLNTAQPINARAAFMPVTGNHDVVNKTTEPDFQKPFQVFRDNFNLPKDQLNYSFDYGNTHFVAINSGFAQGAAKVNKLLFEKGSSEYQWLASDLAKARKNKNTDWIILYMHYPMYSFGVSWIPGWQSNITPLLDQYKVDLCLSGHRHVYERHKPIRNNQISEQEDAHNYQKPQGTFYITNGSAGGSLQGIGGSEMPSMLFTSPEKMYNYAIMTIEGETILYDVYNNKGDKIDYFELSK